MILTLAMFLLSSVSLVITTPVDNTHSTSIYWSPTSMEKNETRLNQVHYFYEDLEITRNAPRYPINISFTDSDAQSGDELYHSRIGSYYFYYEGYDVLDPVDYKYIFHCDFIAQNRLNYNLDVTLKFTCQDYPNISYTFITQNICNYVGTTSNSYETSAIELNFANLTDDLIDGTYWSLDLYLDILSEDVYDFYNGGDKYQAGYDEGVRVTEEQHQNDYQNGYDNGKTDGIAEGYEEAKEIYEGQSATATTIFSGILSIGLTPVNFFLQMLNFEVFGINIGGFVSSLLSIAIVIIIIKMLIGNGGGKSD